MNIIQELLDKSVKGEAVELKNNCIAVVFNFKNEDVGSVIDNIYKTSKMMAEIIESEYYVMINTAVSGWHKGEENLNVCYEEAMAALYFRFTDDEEVLIRYDMINNNDMSETV